MNPQAPNYWQPGDDKQATSAPPQNPVPEQQLPPAAPPVAPPQPAPVDDGAFEWSAPEYQHHEKSAAWFVILGAITLVATVAAVVLGQYFFAALIVAMGCALGFFAARPPRTVRYRLTGHSVQVGDKTFELREFRSFGILGDSPFFSIRLLPVKKLSPAVNLFFSDAEGEHIVDVLAASLPMEELQLDGIEKIMQRLRF